MTDLIFYITLIGLLFVYFMPAVIAGNRKHNNAAPILLINLFLGWTGIGWFIALVWASTDNVKT